MTIRMLALLSMVLLGAGCAGKNTLNDFRVSMGFISPYEAAVDEFKQGQVMEASSRLLSIDKDHEDYKKAQTLLKKKVEPARLKLLRYYARKGKSEEAAKRWAQAEEAYKSASGLSKSPKALLRYQKNMGMKVRQLRAESIYAQRMHEDEVWLKWLDSYNPPHGLLGDDETFVLARENVQDMVEKRAKNAWLLAEKYNTLDMPEMAWVYADSYLQIKPDAKKAQDLKLAMAKAMPKEIDFAKLTKKKKNKRASIAVTTAKSVSKTDVQKLIQQEKWLEARKTAKLLRRQGDAAADPLLEKINQKTEQLAAKAYTDGNLFFRLERIEEAVKSWGRAVKLMPNDQIYVDALRKGLQIQERLSALKKEESPSEAQANIEE